MKSLQEIAKPEYSAGIKSHAETEGIVRHTEEADGILFTGRFLAGSLAVEGLVVVHGVYEDNTVRFHLANDDGRPVGELYSAPIDVDGIIGASTIKDVRVLRVEEGYFQLFESDVDRAVEDELGYLMPDLIPAHVAMGGAEGDNMRRQLLERSLNYDT